MFAVVHVNKDILIHHYVYKTLRISDRKYNNRHFEISGNILFDLPNCTERIVHHTEGNNEIFARATVTRFISSFTVLYYCIIKSLTYYYYWQMMTNTLNSYPDGLVTRIYYVEGHCVHIGVRKGGEILCINRPLKYSGYSRERDADEERPQFGKIQTVRVDRLIYYLCHFVGSGQQRLSR